MLSWLRKKKAPGCALSDALQRITSRGLPINTVIDVGASNGSWSKQAEQFWPAARFHLIEAFQYWEAALEQLAKRKRNYSYVLAAAGPSNGAVQFTNSVKDPFGGAATVSPGGPNHWTVPMVAIDAEVSRLDLEPPFLVKLDTHGFEREIIDGARETLRHTNLFINEFYNFQAEDKRWPRMVMYVESLGFRCVDMIEPGWRDLDRTLWQMDFAFVPRDRPEFSRTSFR